MWKVVITFDGVRQEINKWYHTKSDARWAVSCWLTDMNCKRNFAFEYIKVPDPNQVNLNERDI